jgi:hypothetical protein
MIATEPPFAPTVVFISAVGIPCPSRRMALATTPAHLRAPGSLSVVAGGPVAIKLKVEKNALCRLRPNQGFACPMRPAAAAVTKSPTLAA